MRGLTLVAAFLVGTFLVAATARGEEGASETVMDEVVVTATRTPVSVVDVPQSVAVVDRSDLEQAGGRLEDALDRIPAFRVNRTGSRFMALLPTIRGSQPGEVLVLLDGRRLNSQQSGWFNLGDLPLSSGFIERVEVLEDSSSALYGAEAVGGVVNVISRDPLLMPAVGLDLSAGSLGSRGMELSLSRAVGPGAVSASFGREYTDGWRENTDAARNTYDFRGTLPGSDLTVDVFAGQRATDLGSPGPADYPTPRARQHDTSTVYGVSGTSEFAGGVALSADVFYNRWFREYQDPDWGTASRHLTHAAGGSLRTVLDAGVWGRCTAGVEAVWDDLESSNDGQRSMDRQGVFVQDELSLVGGVSAAVTARFDRFSLFAEQFSPRLALVYRAGDAVSLRGSVARGYRTPTFDDLYWSDPWMQGNPDLQPESSWNWELGISGGTKTSAYDVNAFLRDVDDMIRWQDDDGDWVYTPENVDEARVSGCAVSLRTEVASVVGLDGGYLYVYPEDRVRGQAIAGRLRQQVKGGVTVKAAWFDTRLDTAWIDRYEAPNLDEESYWTTSLRLSRTLGPADGRSMTLSLWVDNLLDEEYEVTPGYPMPGREIGFEASWAF